ADPGRVTREVLRHAYLQPAALHAADRADPKPGHRSGHAQRPRILAGDPPWQKHRACEGYAKLRRQPHRTVLHPGSHAPHGEVRPGSRRGGWLDREADRTSGQRDVPYRRHDRPDTLSNVTDMQYRTLPDDPWR